MKQIDNRITIGSLTNKGQVLWIDTISTNVPDPLVKVSSEETIKYRLSDLTLEDNPSIKEAFEELRKIIGKYWDKEPCICSALGRSKCQFNCSEFKE